MTNATAPDGKRLDKHRFLIFWGTLSGFALLWFVWRAIAWRNTEGYDYTFAESLIERYRFGYQQIWVILAAGAAATVVLAALVYRMWGAIQDKSTSLTPAKAAGLLFIPFFNIFWIARAIGGYPWDYNAYIGRKEIAVPRLKREPFRWYCALAIGGVLFPFASVLLLIIFKVLVSDFDARVTAERLVLVGVPLVSFLAGAAAYVIGLVMISRSCDAVNALVDARSHASPQAEGANALV